MTNNEIEQLSGLLNKVRAESKKDKEYAFNQPFPTFLTVMSFLNPQSYGQRIQNRICQSLGWKKIKATDDKGDILCSTDQKSYEVKTSLITETNDALNLVQIRLWQNVDYICLWFNTKTKEYSTYVLTHEQMEDEVLTMGTSAHGTKTSNQVNEKKEIRISLNIDKNDLHFQRWEDMYKSDLLDFLFKNK